MEHEAKRFRRADQLFVSEVSKQHLLPVAAHQQEPGTVCRVCFIGQALQRRAMDWRSSMIRAETVRDTREDEAAYAAGWTISGLATLGTIIAVWMFAI